MSLITASHFYFQFDAILASKNSAWQPNVVLRVSHPSALVTHTTDLHLKVTRMKDHGLCVQTTYCYSIWLL